MALGLDSGASLKLYGGGVYSSSIRVGQDQRVILSNSGEPEAREWPRSDRPGVVDMNPGVLTPALPGHAFPHTVLSRVPLSSAGF